MSDCYILIHLSSDVSIIKLNVNHLGLWLNNQNSFQIDLWRRAKTESSGDGKLQKEEEKDHVRLTGLTPFIILISFTVFMPCLSSGVIPLAEYKKLVYIWTQFTFLFVLAACADMPPLSVHLFSYVSKTPIKFLFLYLLGPTRSTVVKKYLKSSRNVLFSLSLFFYIYIDICYTMETLKMQIFFTIFLKQGIRILQPKERNIM